MLEGTDAKVHFIRYTPEMEEARSHGELRINSFVRLRRLSGRGPLRDVIDLGDAELLLRSPRHLAEIDAPASKMRASRRPRTAGAAGWDDTRRRCAGPPARSRSRRERTRRENRSVTGIVRGDADGCPAIS